MITRADVIAEALTWKGTPYVHQGRLKGRGVDCLGLVAMVGKALGLTDYDRLDYGRLPNPRRMREELKAHLREISLTAARPGDVVHMSWGIDPMHLGILTPAGIVHAYSLIPAVVEHPVDAGWRAKMCFAYAFPGLD